MFGNLPRYKIFNGEVPYVFAYTLHAANADQIVAMLKTAGYRHAYYTRED